MPRKSGSKTVKKTRTRGRSLSGKKLYYGIDNKPKRSIYAGAGQSLNDRQVRRFGEYEIPHKKMIQYLKARGLPPPDYKKYGLKGGSKTSKKRVTKI